MQSGGPVLTLLLCNTAIVAINIKPVCRLFHVTCPHKARLWSKGIKRRDIERDAWHVPGESGRVSLSVRLGKCLSLRQGECLFASLHRCRLFLLGVESLRH